MQPTLSNRKVCPATGQAARRSRHQKDKIQKRAGRSIAHDFLSQQFFPISFSNQFKQPDWLKIQKDFFKSAKHLSMLYNLAPCESCHLPYPINISSAYKSLKDQLGKQAPKLYLIISENKNESTLATVKSMGIDHNLFLVPINALDNLHQDQQKESFDLLLSIFSYLNQKAGMPLQSENDYLESCYDAIFSYATDPDNEPEDEMQNDQWPFINMIRRKTAILEKNIQRPQQLQEFSVRINRFKPRTDWQHSLLSTAQQFYDLYQEFPDQNFFQNIESAHLQDYEDGDRAYPEMYFSFFWDDNDWIYQQIMEYVNCDLQEKYEFELPVSVQYFNTRQACEKHQLPFETKLIQLIEQLCTTLYQYNYEKQH
ncbi:hypothetical protein [Sediminibacterium ginsengisoli]|nr:hypothetical protein [Sediminibacterium ginsengisoli]